MAERVGRTRVRGPKFEVFRTSNPELRTSDRAFLTCRALLALQSVASCDSNQILGGDYVLLDTRRWLSACSWCCLICIIPYNSPHSCVAKAPQRNHESAAGKKHLDLSMFLDIPITNLI